MVHLKKILILALIFYAVSALAWDRQSISYPPQVYKGGTQNWQIQQSEKGWLYVANNNGLLEFDGYSWTLHSMKGHRVRALNLVSDKVYVGGSSEFGYFKRGPKDLFSFHSLSTSINDNWKGDIWNIFHVDNKVHMLDDYHAYVFENDKHIYTVNSKYKIDCSALIDDKIYIGTPQGVGYLDKASNQFVMCQSENGERVLDNSKIVELLPYKDKMIVATARQGIYLVGKNTCEPIRSKADNFIQQNQLFSATIRNNRLTLGSVQNGVFIIDLADPTHQEAINQDNMLKNNTVLSCFFDNNRNLWLGLDNGIAFVNMDNLINPLFSKDSAIGTGYCSASYNGVLYFGTNQGLYVQDNKQNYNLIKGGEGQIISLFNYDDKLFSCGDNGILIMDRNETYKINISGAVKLLPVKKHKNKLVVITYFGSQVIEKKNSKWQYLHTIDNSSKNSDQIDKKWANLYWQADIGDNFVKALFIDEKLEHIAIKEYSIGNHKVSSNNAISIVDDNIVVCTSDGLYRYAPHNDSMEKYAELEDLLGSRTDYQYIYIDKIKNLWFKADGSLYLFPHSNNYLNKEVYYIGLESQMVEGSENIQIQDSTQAIIGTYQGFTMIRTDKVQSTKSPSQVYINKVRTSKDDSIVAYGETKEGLNLPYELNSIGIDWGAFNIGSHDVILFSHRLIGLDDDWSIPTTKTSKEYTNLKEGHYTFEVRTIIKNKEMEVANSDYITFEILPPWYRSTLAHCVYLLIFVISLYFLYKAIIRKQEKEIEEKKKTIELQRLLLEEEKREKDQIINEMEKEKLQTDLQHKTQEVTGYILNINKKNEIFDKVKKEAELVLKAIDNKDNISKMRKRISDMIVVINNDMSHDEDFDVFKSNFDIVHSDFFKALEQKYPQLTKKDKVLCAYIKMGLLSKEIAPLLNISVRGVEINRYNLRKKMDLNRNVNLNEHIDSLSNE